MTLRDDGVLDAREQELLHLWREFCQDWHAASFVTPTVDLADEFGQWLAKRWTSAETERQMREGAAIWWRTRDLGLFSWERDVLLSWVRFSNEDLLTDFARVGPTSVNGFATWLANHEPASRTRVEELDLSIRAYNLLRSRNVRFIDQIDLEGLDDPLGRKVKTEIAERLRRWRGDDGMAGVPARL